MSKLDSNNIIYDNKPLDFSDSFSKYKNLSLEKSLKLKEEYVESVAKDSGFYINEQGNLDYHSRSSEVTPFSHQREFRKFRKTDTIGSQVRKLNGSKRLKKNFENYLRAVDFINTYV